MGPKWKQKELRFVLNGVLGPVSEQLVHLICVTIEKITQYICTPDLLTMIPPTPTFLSVTAQSMSQFLITSYQKVALTR